MGLYSDLPPSQGGKYSGFGYSREQPPRSQSQEFFENTMSSLATVSIAEFIYGIFFVLYSLLLLHEGRVYFVLMFYKFYKISV